MTIPENYNPVELILALRKAKAEGVAGEADEFQGALVIDTSKLSSTDKENLKHAFVGEYFGQYYYHWICNNFMKPIQFESNLIAYETAESQKHSLETRLLYDIYRRTGVKLQAPHKDTVQII